MRDIPCSDYFVRPETFLVILSSVSNRMGGRSSSSTPNLCAVIPALSVLLPQSMGVEREFGLSSTCNDKLHGKPANCAKMGAEYPNCERHLAFLPSCASLYCEVPDDAPAAARCFDAAFGRQPKGEPR